MLIPAGCPSCTQLGARALVDAATSTVNTMKWVDQLRIHDNKVFSKVAVGGDAGAGAGAGALPSRPALRHAAGSYSLRQLFKQQSAAAQAPRAPPPAAPPAAALAATPAVQVLNRSSRHFHIRIRYRTAAAAPPAVARKRGRPRKPADGAGAGADTGADTGGADDADPAATKPPTFETLPYRGVLPFPDCTVNHTEPCETDRRAFRELWARGEARRGVAAPPATARISAIRFREFEIDTWYTAPYPSEYSHLPILYICEYCLKYMDLPMLYERHALKNCNLSNRHPPGTEIYRDAAQRVSVWEVDGRKNIHYCQNLCLLAKLFLNLKTLYYDVEPFVFYVLTEIDAGRHHFVGYFLKEKLNSLDYNVLCILTLPIYQRRGYGQFLIDFSYLLSRREFKFGTPEKPLSDLGLVSYRSYWRTRVAMCLRRLVCAARPVRVTIEILSKLTGMTPSDVIVGLEQLRALVRRGSSGEDAYAIVVNPAALDAEVARVRAKRYVTLDESKLLWKPMLFGPSGGINSAPAVPHPANSVAHIVNFLRDDLNNPYSFEDEAIKEMECYRDMGGDDAPLGNYAVCDPSRPAVAVPDPVGEATLREQRDKVYMEVEAEEADEEEEGEEEDDDQEDESVDSDRFEEELEEDSQEDSQIDEESQIEEDSLIDEDA